MNMFVYVWTNLYLIYNKFHIKKKIKENNEQAYLKIFIYLQKISLPTAVPLMNEQRQ